MTPDTVDTTQAQAVGVPRFVRVPMMAMARLAESQAMDILEGHGRLYVGPWQKETLQSMGVVPGTAILPLFGDRWFKSIEDWMRRKCCEALRRFHHANKNAGDLRRAAVFWGW